MLLRQKDFWSNRAKHPRCEFCRKPMDILLNTVLTIASMSAKNTQSQKTGALLTALLILGGGGEVLGFFPFCLMIFFMVTTSPFLQNSHVQNKVWPSCKQESLVGVPSGKEFGVHQKQWGYFVKRGSWRSKLLMKLGCTSLDGADSVTFAKHGSTTSKDTHGVWSCSPCRCQT